MNKHVGANKRKKYSEQRKRIGTTLTKAASKSAPGFLFVALAILVVGGAAYGALKAAAWIKRSPMFAVSSITVEGVTRIDRAEAVRLSGIKAGMRIMDINSANAARDVMKNPWVKSVGIVRHYPSSVVIRIRERTPVALASAGGVYYVDDEGMLLPLFPGTYSNLPLITGMRARLDSVKCLEKKSFERAMKFLDECKTADGAFVKRVSQIDFSGDPVIRLSLEDMPAVIDMTDADTKTSVARLKQLFESVQDDPKGCPKHINLCYENLAYVQW